MKGPKELKHYISKYKNHLNKIQFDDLFIFKSEKDKKYRKIKRRSRDGSYGKSESYIEL